MLLNLTIIRDYMNDIQLLHQKTDRLKKRTLKFPVFYAGETVFQPDRVYVALAEQLSPSPEAGSGGALICLGYPPAAYHEQDFEMLCIPTTISIQLLFNQLQEIFNQFHDYERRLENAIQQENPFQAAGEAALAIFQTPVSAFDRYDKYLFLAFQPDRPEFLDSYLNTLDTGYSFDEERSILMADKEFQKTYATHGPAYGDSSIYGTSSVYMNIFEGEQYMGRVLIENAYRPFRDSDYPLIEWLAGYLQNMIIKTGKFYFSTSQEFERMMRFLLLEHAGYRKEYDKILLQRQWLPDDSYQCVYIRPSAESLQTTDINNEAFYLRDFFDSHYILVHEDSIYQVINLSRTGYTRDEIRKRLQLFLDNNSCVAGLSIEFQDFPGIWVYLQQAILSADQEEGLTGRRVFPFEDNVLSIMLRQAKGSYSSEFYCTNAVKRLFRYDEENNAQLAVTLKCYLDNHLNATKTQEILHIARTTCLYRIQRIEQIMGVDLKDTDMQLYLSLLFRVLRTV